KAPASTRILLLHVLARCRLDGLPGPLAAAVAGALDDPDVSVRREAVATARLRKLAGLGGRLRRLALRPDLPGDLRIAALEAPAGGGEDLPLDAAPFDMLLRHLAPSVDPVVRVAAARAVRAYGLSDGQLVRLAGVLGESGPAVAPLLIPAFTR